MTVGRFYCLTVEHKMKITYMINERFKEVEINVYVNGSWYGAYFINDTVVDTLSGCYMKVNYLRFGRKRMI